MLDLPHLLVLLEGEHLNEPEQRSYSLNERDRANREIRDLLAVASHQKGKAQHAVELIRQHYDLTIRSTVRRFAASPQDADEAVHDTYVALLRAAASGQYRDENLAGWIHRIARNAALRSLKVRLKYSEVHKHSHDVLAATFCGTVLKGLSSDEKQELLRDLREIIGKLPERQQMCWTFYARSFRSKDTHSSRLARTRAIIERCTGEELTLEAVSKAINRGVARVAGYLERRGWLWLISDRLDCEE